MNWWLPGAEDGLRLTISRYEECYCVMKIFRIRMIAAQQLGKITKQNLH